MRKIVKIILNTDFTYMESDVFGALAAHEAIPAGGNDLYTVTYLPTGQMLMHCRSQYRAIEAAQLLAPHFDAVPSTPQEYRDWISAVQPIILAVKAWDDTPQR